MRHLKRPKEFADKEVLDKIIDKLSKRGYLSSKLVRALDSIAGRSGVLEEITNRAEDIYEFFEKYPLYYDIDDFLLGVFDNTNYRYYISSGFLIGDYNKAYFYLDKYNDHRDIYINEYSDSRDKKNFLVDKIVKSILEGMVESKAESDRKNKEDDEQKIKIKNWFSMKSKPSNFLKDVDKIFPFIEVTMINRDREDYDATFGESIVNGFNYSGIYNISSAISSRLNQCCPEYTIKYCREHDTVDTYYSDAINRGIKLKTKLDFSIRKKGR